MSDTIEHAEKVYRPAYQVPANYGQSLTMFDVIVDGENFIHLHAEREGIGSDFRATYKLIDANGDRLPGLYQVGNAKLERW